MKRGRARTRAYVSCTRSSPSWGLPHIAHAARYRRSTWSPRRSGSSRRDCGGTTTADCTHAYRAALLDGQLPLHPVLPVLPHRAVEGVRPGLQLDGDRRRLTGLDRLALLVDAVALDRHRVRHLVAVRVVHRDGDATRGRL